MANTKGGGRWHRRCDVRTNKFGKVLGGHHHHDGTAVQYAERCLNRALRKHERALCRAYEAGEETPCLPAMERRVRNLSREVNWKRT